MPKDTTREARARQVRAWREMGAERRLEIALELSEAVRTIALDGLRSRYPDASEAELTDRLVATR